MYFVNSINGKELIVAVLVGVVGALCFYPSIDGEFVFDDVEAILNNKDLKPNTPLSELFRHDFWGTDLLHNSSHKSYRPLTVLSFRLHVWLDGGELNPRHFHLMNVFLHGSASALLCPVIKRMFNCRHLWDLPVILTTLLFALHPVHSEAVAGLVGRADLLSGIFSFLSLLAYSSAGATGTAGSESSPGPQSAPAAAPQSCCRSLALTLLSTGLAALAMLTKEQGITVLGICSVYDILVVNQISPSDIWNYFTLHKNYIFEKILKMDISFGRTFWTSLSMKHKLFLMRHIVLFISGCSLVLLRCWLMDFSTPVFRDVDNPHSFAPSFFERIINYNYIYALNGWLLICPEWLCFDWSMGCIPLIKLENIFSDLRVIVVILFWVIFALLISTSLKSSQRIHPQKQREVLLALSCIIIPFSVASNLLFRVGFVIAERILYLPSLGYCMLIALGLRRLLFASQSHCRLLIKFCISFLLLINALRCLQRSLDWRSQRQLFSKGLQVCPLNAKIHYNHAKTSENTSIAIKHYREAIRLYPEYEQAMNNLANILRENGNFSEAERLLRKAISIRPDFAAAWMNLGIAMATIQNYEESLKCYNTALKFRKNYPDCYYNLGNLFLSQKMETEAIAAWSEATRLKPLHSLSWNNLIVLFDSQGDLDKAEILATEALTILPNDSALHFNLANTLGKKGVYERAEVHFRRAIELKQNQPLYHTNFGVLYHRWKKYKKAEEQYKIALSLNPSLTNVVKNLKTVQRLMRN